MKKLLMNLAVITTVAVAACAGPSNHDDNVIGSTGHTPIAGRPMSVIADTCILDTWQLGTLGSASARRVLAGGDVILLCLIPREDGTVGPRDPSSTALIAGQATQLRGWGYHVRLGVSFTDETGVRFDGEQTREWLDDPKWRAQFLTTIDTVIESVDGVELDLENLPAAARDDVSELVATLGNQIRPLKTLGLFVPPSVTIPSDLPDGDAFALPELAPFVDHFRVMTLDYSIGAPGPTIDPGWAVDAGRLALSQIPNGAVDIAYPLYGTDFGPRGPRLTSYDEAIATAVERHSAIERGPTTAPYELYASVSGEAHQIWYDDAQSTVTALGAWDTGTLPVTTGVVFYGLGNEDPALWDAINARLLPRGQ